MTPRGWLICGSLLAGLAVALGALGAHGLESRFQRPGMSLEELAAGQKKLDNFEVGVRYQMLHALALLALGLIAARGASNPSGLLQAAGFAFLLGIVLFSGMLYGWVFTESKALVMLVPIGGVSFIVGWVLLALAVWRAN
ncbi:MAG: DUF423 domain-containing protein [Pirellulales bacterium]